MRRVPTDCDTAPSPSAEALGTEAKWNAVFSSVTKLEAGLHKVDGDLDKIRADLEAFRTSLDARAISCET